MDAAQYFSVTVTSFYKLVRESSQKVCYTFPFPLNFPSDQGVLPLDTRWLLLHSLGVWNLGSDWKFISIIGVASKDNESFITTS